MMTRYLSLSLLAAVLLSLIVVGTGINYLYSYFEPADHTEELFFKTLALDYRDAVDEGAIDSADIPPLLQASVLEQHDFPLPSELLIGFHAGEPLSLASENGVFTYLYLPQRQQVLSLRVPEPREAKPWLNLALTLLFYSIIAIAVLLWLLPLIKSLQRLQAVALRFGQGDFSARVAAERFSPIADIESAFNDMAAKIARLLDDNRLLGRAVSHELKTPLARLRLGIDVIADTVPDTAQHYIERIDTDLDEMQALIDALLKYSRLEGANVQVNSVEVDLLALCEKQAAAFSGYDVHFSLKASPQPLLVMTDLSHITMIISNLVANAVHYGQGAVAIQLEQGLGAVHVLIEDNGPGIPEAQRARVFIPFERLADDKRPAGHGIGLAAVDKLAQLLAIQVDIGDSTALGGAVFHLTIPCESKQR